MYRIPCWTTACVAPLVYVGIGLPTIATAVHGQDSKPRGWEIGTTVGTMTLTFRSCLAFASRWRPWEALFT
jgi:hypothetical protein